MSGLVLLEHLASLIEGVSSKPKCVPDVGILKDIESDINALMTEMKEKSGSPPKSTASLECVSGLGTLILNPHISQNLLLKSLDLLEYFGKDDKICEAMCTELKVMSSLNILLSKKSSEVCVSVLKLVQTLTYGKQNSRSSNWIGDIVEYVINEILSGGRSYESFELCLEVLANVCSRDMAVQAFVKELPSVKALQRKLLAVLAEEKINAIILSLYILCVLFLDEEIGNRIFNSGNIEQTFHLVFSVLCSSHGDFVGIRYAVDLFVHLLSCERVQEAIVKYPNFGNYTRKLFELLQNKDENMSCKILELCLAFCNVYKVRSSLVEIVLHEIGSRKDTPISLLLNWACHPNQFASLTALDILKELFEEVVDGEAAKLCLPAVKLTLPQLASLCETPHKAVSEEVARISLTRCYKSLLVVSVLWSVKSFSDLVSQHLTCDMLGKIIQLHFSIPVMGYGEHSSWNSASIMAFELLLKFRRHSQQAKAMLWKLLQDQRVFPIIASSLSSTNKRSVLAALQLVAEACKSVEFDILGLAEVLANGHASIADKKSERCQPKSRRHFPCAQMSDVNSTNVETLIEKFKSGFELKDLKSSEIIEIYECKLQAMANGYQSKEDHIQDLVDAKSLALVQADRLIYQYRTRKNQCENECLRLRSLIKESEKRSEALEEKVESLQQKCRELFTTIEDYQNLTSTFQQQKSQLEAMLKSLQKEKDNITCCFNELEEEHQTLKSQHESVLVHLRQAEYELAQTKTCLQSSENEVKRLQLLHEECKASCASLQNEKGAIKEEVTSLKKQKLLLLNEHEGLKEAHSELQVEVTHLKDAMRMLKNENARLSGLFSAVKNLISNDTRVN